MTSPPVATRAGLGVGARDNCEVALVGKLLRLVARRGVGQLPAPEASIIFSIRFGSEMYRLCIEFLYDRDRLIRQMNSTIEAVCGAEGIVITCLPQ